MQKFEVREISCWYCGKRGHVKRNCWFLEKAKRQPKDEDTDSVIEDFLANLDLVESKILQEKVKTKCHVHWWDGWKKEETSAEEKEGLKYSLLEDFLDSTEEEDAEEEDAECGRTTVDYPFWIKKPDCGYPGFQIICKKDEDTGKMPPFLPALVTNNTHRKLRTAYYKIWEIDYSGYMVINSISLRASSCPEREEADAFVSFKLPPDGLFTISVSNMFVVAGCYLSDIDKCRPSNDTSGGSLNECVEPSNGGVCHNLAGSVSSFVAINLVVSVWVRRLKKRNLKLVEAKYFQQLQQYIASTVGRESVTMFSDEELEKASDNYSNEMVLGKVASELYSKAFYGMGCCLPWVSRLQIAMETAEALVYLHFGASRPIFHRDVKSSNIILNETFSPKVADFGISRLISASNNTHVTTNNIMGTKGYLDPEYFQTYQLTDKSDVYSFGVVLVELITGLEPLSVERSSDEWSLSTLFLNRINHNRLREILDRKVLEEETIQQMEATGRLARECLHSERRKRSSMKEVAEEL
ncbi:wall-associated receptor kinase-like 9 [Cryptomeria japonica]|uniref:wall-associated receptor kinase-like 9 n=1 Tax=Cryptomeria japonica TaxID=3369 RepID=UPI0027DA8969|nr:wall-associated receptor kinase-like 9 [Cryptomeria japonica]